MTAFRCPGSKICIQKHLFLIVSLSRSEFPLGVLVRQVRREQWQQEESEIMEAAPVQRQKGSKARGHHEVREVAFILRLVTSFC